MTLMEFVFHWLKSASSLQGIKALKIKCIKNTWLHCFPVSMCVSYLGKIDETGSNYAWTIQKISKCVFLPIFHIFEPSFLNKSECDITLAAANKPPVTFVAAPTAFKYAEVFRIFERKLLQWMTWRCTAWDNRWHDCKFSRNDLRPEADCVTFCRIASSTTSEELVDVMVYSSPREPEIIIILFKL